MDSILQIARFTYILYAVAAFQNIFLHLLDACYARVFMQAFVLVSGVS